MCYLTGKVLIVYEKRRHLIVRTFFYLKMKWKPYQETVKATRKTTNYSGLEKRLPVK